MIEKNIFSIIGRKVILRIRGRMCETEEELFNSPFFKKFLSIAIERLKQSESRLLGIFGTKDIKKQDLDDLTKVFLMLTKMPYEYIIKINPEYSVFFRDIHLLNDLVEFLYNYWRSFDRFIIADSEGDRLDKRPYRTFNDTNETLTHLVRKIYRDLQENITGKHPRIYRQVAAGANFSSIAIQRQLNLPGNSYEILKNIKVIRQVLLNPPLILDPPMNKRTGRFQKVNENPLNYIENIDPDEWLCYPANVGHYLIFIYFHQKFYELGFSLSNLFELANDEYLKRRPDAIYLFGVPGKSLYRLSELPTVFYDDKDNNILIATIPNDDTFGYFGYLKKMVLTLHNVIVMKKGLLPYHGAFFKIILKNNRESNILIIGDSGSGKSETIEAMRILGEELIKDMIVIADDMGSIEIKDDGEIIAYGTEIGAFLRLDDLPTGYAFGQIDRAIIMSPTKVNARIVIPVTTYETVIKGHKVDLLFYANNYEEIDEDHPTIERFNTPEEALKVFREGTVMSKGTTTSTGIVHSYFANIFGPPQYKDLHEKIAVKYFNHFFRNNLFVGQIRTRLGIKGFEKKGPEESARELIKLLEK
ncbi:MAG: phosphoenolpyruvate carboxykinase [Candidatus Marinimicrobia bacterium]|nr:phosphoenolpyruvate carboxykinase [Candidatus Neomarinimicrobiota bacterium]